MPSNVPKLIHFSIINDVESSNLDYIKIWANMNPDYTIKIWHNKTMFLRKLLYKELFHSFKNSIPQNGFNKSFIEVQVSIWKKIYEFEWHESDQLLGDRIESFFSGLSDFPYLTPETIRNNVLFELNKRNDFFRKINLINNAKTFEFSEDWGGNYFDIIQLSLSLSDSWMAERFIALRALHMEGGIYLNNDVLPKLNARIFSKRVLDGSISSMPDSDVNTEPLTTRNLNENLLERFKVNEVLKKMSSQGLISSEHGNLSLPADWSIPQGEISRIKNIIRSNDYKNIFSSIGTIRITNNKIVYVGYKGEDDLRPPLVIVSLPDSPLIQDVIDETKYIYDLARNSDKQGKDYREVESMILGGLKTYYASKKINLSSNAMEVLKLVAFRWLLGTVTQYGVSNEIMSVKSLERTATQVNKKHKLSIFDDYSSNTPKANEEIKSYSFNKQEIFGRLSYDSLILIDLNKDNDLLGIINEYYVNNSVSENSVFYRFNSESEELRIVKGSPPVNIGENTKVVIVAHGLAPGLSSLQIERIQGRIPNYSIEGHSPEKLADILSTVIPQGTELKKIVLDPCWLAEGLRDFKGTLDESKKLYVPEFLRALARKNIFAVTTTASNRSHTRKEYSKNWHILPKLVIETDRQGVGQIREGAVHVRSPELTSYIYTLDPDRKTVHYQSKLGLASYKPDILATNGHLPDANLYPSVFLTKWPSSKTQDPSFLYITNSDVIKHGLDYQGGVGYVVYANKNESDILRLLKALKFSMKATSYSDWVNLFESYHSMHGDEIRGGLALFQTESKKRAAFLRLKARASEGQFFHLYHLDIFRAEGASILNFRYPRGFLNMGIPQSWGQCSRRRRSVSVSSCNSRIQIKEALPAIKLLSDSQTQLYLSDSKTDIALVDTVGNSQLAKLQRGFVDFRRREAKAEARQRTGYHNFIALDDPSFTLAKSKLTNAGQNARAFLLKATVSSGNVLLSPEGIVKSGIEGGDGNQITLLGRTESLTANIMATVIADFTSDGKISHLTLTGMTVDGLADDSSTLQELSRFINSPKGKYQIEELVIQPLDTQPESLKPLAQRIASLSGHNRQAVKGITLRSNNAASLEYRIFPGETRAFQQAVDISAVGKSFALPAADLPGIKSADLPEADRGRQKDFIKAATFKAEFQQRLVEFDAALNAIKSKYNLSHDTVPLLNSLTRDNNFWRMDFVQPGITGKTSLAFKSGAFHRFKSFMEDHDRQFKGSKTGKKTFRTASRATEGFLTASDIYETIVNLAKLQKISRPEGMTEPQYQIYLGRHYLFYMATALQGAEIVGLGIRGLKAILPGKSHKTLAVLDVSASGKGKLSKILSYGRKLKPVTKIGRFFPIVGTGLQAANLGLVLAEYSQADDPQVRELLEKRVIFETVDTYVSTGSEFAGQYGLIADVVMLVAREIFESWYKGEEDELYKERLAKIVDNAPEKLNNVHKYLNPKLFLDYDHSWFNFLRGDEYDSTGKPIRPLLPIGIREINLVKKTFTYGRLYTNRQSLIYDHLYLNHQGDAYAGDRAQLIAGSRFDMVASALKTLCRKEDRLKKYQCADGVYKNVPFLSRAHGNNTILMPAVPDRSVSLTYTKYEEDYGELSSERNPGMIFLDAIEDHLLKRHYIAVIQEEASKPNEPDYSLKSHNYLLTDIEDGDTFKTSSTLHMADENYKLIFSNPNYKKYSGKLDYHIHALKGAQRQYTLLSGGPHTINLTPHENTASQWFLAYTGGTEYTCIAEQDWAIENCHLEGAGGADGKSGHVKSVKLGETQYSFNTPAKETTTDSKDSYTYKVMSSDANALFEFLPNGKNKISRFYYKAKIDDAEQIEQREAKFTRLLSRYTAATRFIPVELRGCDPEPDFQGRLPVASGGDYSCFPGRLGLPEAESAKLDQVLIWFDTKYQKEIRLIGESTNVKPIQGTPKLGYYFLDQDSKRLFLKKYKFLRRIPDIFWVYSHESDGDFLRGGRVQSLYLTGNPSTLIVFVGTYYLHASTDDGKITSKLIAVETTDRNLSLNLKSSWGESLVPVTVVDSRHTRNLLSSGFFDHGPKFYITYRSSLFDGGRLFEKDGRTLEIDDDVKKVLRNEHLPVHKIIEEQTVYYILFSKHSGNLIFLSADIPDGEEKPEVKRIDSGFRVIRPATEQGTMSELKQRIFTRVKAFKDSILADTHHGYRLRIPDESWSSTAQISSAQPVELDSFDQWRVNATGAILPKSNDTISVERFTGSSGIILEELDFGRLVNHAFSHTFKNETSSSWTDQNAATFTAALKKQINKKIHHADRNFAASSELIKLPLITDLNSHPLLAFINNQSFWYLFSSNTLLTAESKDQFKIVGTGDNQLMAKPGVRANTAFEFSLKPYHLGRKEHPFCGYEATWAPKMPDAFRNHLSVPCKYPMYNRAKLPGEYKWDQERQLWSIKVDVIRFEGNREHFRVVEFDLGHPFFIEPVTYNPLEIPYPIYEAYLRAVERLSIVFFSSILADATLIALKLPRTAETVLNPVKAAWFDYQNNLLFAGLPGEPHENLKLLGAKTLQPFEKPGFWSQGVVYNEKSRFLVQTGDGQYWQAGPFNQVEVTDCGLKIQGTSGDDQFHLRHLHLSIFYTTEGMLLIDKQLSPEQRNFSVHMEGSAGADLFVIKESDLGFFSSVVVHPGLASLTSHSGNYSPAPANTPSGTPATVYPSALSGTPTTTHPGNHRNIIRLQSPSYLYAAERQGQDLVLFNRFQPGAGKLRIQQVWPGLFDRPLQPTTLNFRDIHLSIQQLAGEVSRQSGRVVFPMLIDGKKTLGSRRSLAVTAENPLYIKLSPEFTISTRQAVNGVNMIFHSRNQLVDEVRTRRRVFIENSHSHGLAANSVWVQQPDSQSYTPWHFEPVIVHSSLLSGQSHIVKGNAHNNILFVGKETGRRQIQGMAGNDIMLSGSIGKTDSQSKSVMLPLPVIEGDRCHSEKLYIQLSPDSSGESADLIPTFEGGAGNDLYDLRYLRAVRTLDSQGQHHVLLSSRSLSDLRGLSGDKSINLYFTDLKANEVTFNLCDPATGRVKTLMSEGKAAGENTSTADSQVIKIMTPSDFTLALVNTGTLKSLYFKGGKVVRDPAAWLNGKSPLSASDAKKGALGFVHKLVEKAKHPLDYLMQTIGDKRGSTQLRPALSTDIEMASHNAEIYRQFQGMVQAINALGGESVGDNPAFTSKVSQNSSIVTSPLANNGTVGIG